MTKPRTPKKKRSYHNCPNCGQETHQVTHTRRSHDLIDMVHRRRRCQYCGFKWTTVEITKEAFDWATSWKVPDDVMRLFDWGLKDDKALVVRLAKRLVKI